MKKYFVILILILGIFAGTTFTPRNFRVEEKIVFQIIRGQSIKDISDNLAKDKLIWSGLVFRIYAFLSGNANSLQAGCYFISPSMNIPKISGFLSSGNIAKEKITIPEGFTSAQILQRLNETIPISGTSTPGVFSSTPGVNPEIGLVSWEGYLFPDTYEIPYCMEEEKIIEIMTDNFNKKTAGLKIAPEIVIMASILEKEVKTKEEKELVAGILWKRLQIGMPLQVDAYMWTYKNYGLPQKPISNPGLESIQAALNPKQGSYLYYLSTPDGKTIFSKTLEEHNIAKAKYLTGK